MAEQGLQSGAPSALSVQHRGMLEESGIAAKVAEARGYRTVTKKTELRDLGFGDRQCRVPALLIPVYGPSGEISNYQIRPDEPRINDRGKPVKYETPRGSRMTLDVPPGAREWLGHPSRPLFVTEGVKKADAAVSQPGLCCVALLGVWNFRGTNEYGGKVLLAEWESIALNGREVYIVFDSDVMTKIEVHRALARLKGALEQKKARVRLVYLPTGEGGTKVGLDDFLASGKSVDDLLALASSELRPLPDEGRDQQRYEATESGIIWHKPTKDGSVPTRLTNFDARIVADVTTDDGAEEARFFELVCNLNGRSRRFRIPAVTFTSMHWPIEHLGVGAVVEPGMGIRDRARTAIQFLSECVQERRVYTHVGWREIEGSWVYLHAEGAIGPDGPVSDVEVQLDGALSMYALPDPPAKGDLLEAIRAQLRLIDALPDAIGVPLLGAVYRGALDSCDFSLHFTGSTGVGKSEVAALAQQHFGAGMDARHLPGSWSSTDNALEGLAFLAKDAVLVVDDFAPAGTTFDMQRAHKQADRVFRAQGNRSARQRMRADASLRAPRPPRGLLISTGEDVPRGQSLQARMLVLEVGPDDVNWDALTVCQADGREGSYAQATAGFLRHIAPGYREIKERMPEMIASYREEAARSATHRRTPEVVANLALGLRQFIDFAMEVGVLD